jgi:hypothetical protein
MQPIVQNLLSRTEQESAEMLPIVIKLGTAEYKVPVLTISKQRAWREKFFNIATNLEGMLGPTANGDTFKAGLAFVMLRFPEKVAELVFEYAGDVLPQDVVLQQATEEQMARAFSRIMVVAFPFGPALALTTEVLEKAKSYQASAKSTR